jgi:hypothetical protein
MPPVIRLVVHILNGLQTSTTWDTNAPILKEETVW